MADYTLEHKKTLTRRNHAPRVRSQAAREPQPVPTLFDHYEPAAL